MRMVIRRATRCGGQARPSRLRGSRRSSDRSRDRIEIRTRKAKFRRSRLEKAKVEKRDSRMEKRNSTRRDLHHAAFFFVMGRGWDARPAPTANRREIPPA